ncbi:MAG: tetratricopeptide repeat protein [Candidatus Saganbacteria bacterium]|nr:tetratricopeptide repeat protein [Candidatus Saganbacteria bacterium]
MGKKIIISISLFVFVSILAIFVFFLRASFVPVELNTIYELAENKGTLDIEKAKKTMKQFEDKPRDLLHYSDNLSFKECLQYLKLVQKTYPNLLDKGKSDFEPLSVAASAQLRIVTKIFEIIKKEKPNLSHKDLTTKYYPILFSEIDLALNKYKNCYASIFSPSPFGKLVKSGAYALETKANIYLEMGEKKRAIAILKEIIRNFPDSMEIYYEGSGYSDKKAFKQIKDLLYGTPENEPQIADPKEEISFLSSIIKISKGKHLGGEICLRKAELLESLGHYRKAVDIYKLITNKYRLHIHEYGGYHAYLPLTAFIRGMNLCIKNADDSRGKALLKYAIKRSKDDEILQYAIKAYEKEFGPERRILNVLKYKGERVKFFDSVKKDNLYYFIINNDLYIVSNKNVQRTNLQQKFSNDLKGSYLLAWLDESAAKIYIIGEKKGKISLYSSDLTSGIIKKSIADFNLNVLEGLLRRYSFHETGSSFYHLLRVDKGQIFFKYGWGDEIYKFNYADYLSGQERDVIKSGFFTVVSKEKLTKTSSSGIVFDNNNVEGDIIDIEPSHDGKKLLVLAYISGYSYDSTIENLPAFLHIYDLKENKIIDKFLIGSSPVWIRRGKSKDIYYLINNDNVSIVKID